MTGEGEQQRTRQRVSRRRVTLIASLLCLVALIGAGVFYGPRVISGDYHRGAIERLASGVVGRPVYIEGPITLSLLPDPQLVAENIIIGGPHGAQVTASVLKLDLAPGPLLLGRLRATRLALHHPYVTLPWPLPGGADALAPPPWLGSLHATVHDGTFRIGPLRLEHANLSIFTGGPQDVIAASGTTMIGKIPAAIALRVDDTGSTEPAPMTVQLKLGRDARAVLSFHGVLGRDSRLKGSIDVTADKEAISELLPEMRKSSAPLHMTSQFAATGHLAMFENVSAQFGSARIEGQGTLALVPAPMLRITTKGNGVELGIASALLARLRSVVPVAASLDLSGTVAGVPITNASASILADNRSLRAQSLIAMLPGNAAFGFAGTIGPAAAGHFSLRASDPAATLAAFRPLLPFLPSWPFKAGPLDVDGRMTLRPDGRISLDHLQGKEAAGTAISAFTGAARITPTGDRAHVVARLDLARLTLDHPLLERLAGTFSNAKPRYDGSVQITVHQLAVPAVRKGAKPEIEATDLLVDASLHDAAAGGGIHVRLASAHLGRGLLVGRGLRKANGDVIGARIFLAGPDAQSTMTALARILGLPDRWTTRQAFRQPFSLAVAADGTEKALATTWALRLGSLHATAAPVIDFANRSAAGPLTLRAPNAATLIRNLGGTSLLGEHAGLGWPGPGSASLRAAGFVVGGHIGLSDFVASLGALTVSGRINADLANGPPQISGRIAADTLAVPAPSALEAMARTALGSGLRINFPILAAAKVERFGETVAQHASFSLALDQGKLAPRIALVLNRANIAGGRLSGRAVLTGAAGSTPATLSLQTSLTGAQASAVASIAAAHDLVLPLTGGAVDLGANLMAQGDSGQEWQRSLSGSLTASSHGVTISGLDLAGVGQTLGAAIQTPHPVGSIATAHALRGLLGEGSTTFNLLDLTATIGQRTVRLDHAALNGPAGELAAAGHLDLAQDHLDLTLAIRPTVSQAKTVPSLSITIAGPPAHPGRRIDVAAAISWIRDMLEPAAASSVTH